MELILYGIIGSLVGSLIVLITINLFKSKPSIDCQELIKQSEERLEKSKKYGEELDRMLEEVKKQSGGGMVDAHAIKGCSLLDFDSMN